MKKINFRFIVIPVIFLLFTGFFKADDEYYFKLSKSIDLFGEIYKYLATAYVDEVDPEELMYNGLDGMLSGLDPYTVFLEQDEKGEIDLITKGKYGGIGATIGIKNDKITILEVLEGYSAQRQGLHIGDVITKINDEEINKENYNRMSKQIKGDPGSVIKLTINREGVEEELNYSLVREEIEIKNVTYWGLIGDKKNIGYLKLTGFSMSAGDEVKKAIIELRNKTKLEGIVLDLRGNPGGLLEAAIDVSEKFLKKGELVVSVKGRDSLNNREYYSKEEPIAGDIKLIVLVDNFSASASEIVAGAIQDHDRGIILGTQSFGKGLVQTILPLPYNTSVKVTTARYFTPSGRCIQKIDYSNSLKKKNISTEFKTDNKRIVFSAGGIKPDTIVIRETNSQTIKELMAKGVFFNFANYMYNTNNVDNFNENKKLFDKFIEYLNKEKVDFKSEIESSLKEVKNQLNEKNSSKEFKTKLDELISESEKLKQNELIANSDIIVSKIREEFALRTKGKNARIEESLKFDKQIEVSIDIINKNKEFNYILN
ncbi:MAG TPA: S41 family peptidase [Melioribacteraceae bacterium]|nr:S41 family peptidase [Melioribacteraceae bacterium]